MCMIGKFDKIITVPKTAPIVAKKYFSSKRYGYAYQYAVPKKGLFALLHHRRSPYNELVAYTSPPPGPNPTKGFWAYKVDRKAGSNTYYNRPTSRTVLLWGKVAIHEKGFRAEQMLILPKGQTKISR